MATVPEYDRNRLVFFSKPNCELSDKVRKELDRREMAYTEIDITIHGHNLMLANKYSAVAGDIIDEETAWKIDLSGYQFKPETLKYYGTNLTN